MSITPRDITAFKAGSWASLPIDYVIENYGIPYAKKHFGKKAFYSKLSKMPSSRRLTLAPTSGSKYRMPSSVRVQRRPDVLVGMVDHKVATSQLNVTSLTAHNTQDTQLYNLNQGTQMGQRIARMVRASHVEVNAYARNLNNSNILYLRMVCLLDKKPQIGTTNTNLFRAKGDSNDPIDFGIGTSMDTIRSPINTDRFQVLSDRFYRLPANVTANNGLQSKVIKYKFNVKRNLNYLAETTASAVDKVNPNIHFKYWIEKEDGSAGTSLADISCDIYQYFTG